MDDSYKNPLVCVLAYDGMHLFELGIASEVFGLPRPEYEHWYDFQVVATEPGKIRIMGGVTLEASHDLEILKTAALIIVPGWRSAETEVAAPLKEALIEAHARGARLATICSGVFLLAACGLLENKQATTHWRYADLLQEHYPNIQVDPDVLYIDEGSILTSAGSAAGLDLCLHIVRQDFGSEIANQVARRLVLPAHREGGQAQYIPRPVPKERGGQIAPLLDEMRLKLNEEWAVERMASLAGMSARTLLRRFKDMVGESPQAWLTAERIERAKELLETTNLGVSELAEACGLGSPETLRHHFKRRVGTSPLVYRSQFSG